MDGLRHYRQMRGLSQQDLSRLTGVAQNTISEIETGSRDPHFATLRRLAMALDVETLDLFRDPTEPSSTRKEILRHEERSEKVSRRILEKMASEQNLELQELDDIAEQLALALAQLNRVEVQAQAQEAASLVEASRHALEASQKALEATRAYLNKDKRGDNQMA